MADRWPRKCGHCKLYLQKTQYHEHKKMYYCPESRTWKQDSVYGDLPTTSNVQQSEKPIHDTQDLQNEICTDNSSHLEFTNGSDVESDSEVSEANDEIEAALRKEHSRENAVEVWSDDDDIEEAATINSSDHITGTQNYHRSHPQRQENPRISSLIDASLIFLFMWQKLYRISDKAIKVLLSFLSALLLSLADLTGADLLVTLCREFPNTWYKALKRMHSNTDEFIQYVACPTCDKLCLFEDAYTINTLGRKVPKRCGHNPFPSNKRSKPCDSFLLKKVRSKTGTEFLYPKRIACIKPISVSLREMAARPGFKDMCLSWKNRSTKPCYLEDIYDGQHWHDIEPFLNRPGVNLSLMLNVDWFQPFERTKYSVGGIYAVINNLPREERFKDENMLLLCIIPGPKEPKFTINSYLKPIVDELLQLYDSGIYICNDGTSMGSIWHVMLSGVSTDLPAIRKTCGFAGIGAERGCSKCTKTFPRKGGFGTSADYSDFEPSPPRDPNAHRTHGTSCLSARNITSAQKITKETGTRYTELNRLPYYDPIRNHLIDPLHNLLLGGAKHQWEIWKEKGLLDAEQLSYIETSIGCMKTPKDLGRIPSKIGDGASRLTADQWKHWICCYSLVALKDVLPQQHYACWSIFVKACIMLCSKCITRTSVKEAGRFLQLYCTRFCELYGPDKCTINTHMHLHLEQCILDFGPVYSFWCFAFERANGTLGDMQTNNQSIELQLMRKFSRGNHFFSKSKQFLMNDEATHLLNILPSAQKSQGTLLDLTLKTMHVEREEDIHNHPSDPTCLKSQMNQEVKLLPPMTDGYLGSDDVNDLSHVMSLIYQCASIQIIPSVVESRHLKLYSDEISCDASASILGTNVVMAKWAKDINTILRTGGQVMFGVVVQILRVKFLLKPISTGKCQVREQEMLKVQWLKTHTESHKYARPVAVLCPEVENSSPTQFIPAQRVAAQCASLVCNVRFTRGKDKAVVLVPMSSNGTNVFMQ